MLEVHWEKDSLSGSFLQLIVECQGIRAQMAQGVLAKLGYANVVNGMTWGNVQETIDQLPQWGMVSGKIWTRGALRAPMLKPGKSTETAICLDSYHVIMTSMLGLFQRREFGVVNMLCRY